MRGEYLINYDRSSQQKENNALSFVKIPIIYSHKRSSYNKTLNIRFKAFMHKNQKFHVANNLLTYSRKLKFRYYIIILFMYINLDKIEIHLKFYIKLKYI